MPVRESGEGPQGVAWQATAMREVAAARAIMLPVRSGVKIGSDMSPNAVHRKRHNGMEGMPAREPAGCPPGRQRRTLSQQAGGDAVRPAEATLALSTSGDVGTVG